MANLLKILLPFLPLFLLYAIHPTSAQDAAGLTQFRVFWHDVLAGSAPTAVRVAQAASTANSPNFFGAVVVIDDPLTLGPELNSTLLGRAQGTYTFADMNAYGLLMTMNFVFTGGEHNGSSIAIVGRNEVTRSVREMSVVGGTGKFRMAQGYVQARTNALTTNAETVVEYSVFVKTPS